MIQVAPGVAVPQKPTGGADVGVAVALGSIVGVGIDVFVAVGV
jgi:hypothetical protein